MTTIQIKRGLEANRSSITPAAGELIYTTDTKQVFVGDGSTAGGNQVGGGGGAVLEATASGALANGDLVVVNSDGTVSVVAASSVSQTVGTPDDFSSIRQPMPNIAYHEASGKIVVFYAGVSDYPTAVVGTVNASTNSITFGTPAVIDSTAMSTLLVDDAAYDDTNEVIVFTWTRTTGQPGYAVAVSVSGTTPSFGTPVQFNSGSAVDFQAIACHNGKAVLVYQDDGGSDYAYCHVASISGTTLTFGTRVVFDSILSRYFSIAANTTDGTFCAVWSGTGSDGYAIGISVSGTTPSFGTAVGWQPTGTTYFSDIIWDAINAQMIVCARTTNNSGQPAFCFITMSGTALTASAVSYELAGYSISGSSSEILGRPKLVYHSAADTYVLTFIDSGVNPNYLTAAYFTTSAGSVSMGTPFTLDTPTSPQYNQYGYPAYDSDNKRFATVFGIEDAASPSSVIVHTPAFTDTNLTATNYIGISDGTYADTATATIQIATAVDDAQTGLTAGSQYYVQTDGTLSTTAGTPSVLAGTAISSTELIVKG